MNSVDRPANHRALLQVWLFAVALGLPFIGRAYFVDDHYHMLMAQGLLDHPGRPYDFRADDNGADNLGWERGQPPRMVNPPLHHYLLALWWKIGGISRRPVPASGLRGAGTEGPLDNPPASELRGEGGERPPAYAPSSELGEEGRLWAVRLLSLGFSALAAVFIYLLAQRFLVPPMPAAVLSALTPAFWLSSYALLIDSTLLVFFLAALWAWMDGLERGSAVRLAASGLLMGAAILTKYTGGFIVVLAALYWWMEKYKEGGKAAEGLNGSEGRLKGLEGKMVSKNPFSSFFTLLRPFSPLLFLLIPAAILGLWSFWTYSLYGEPHLTAASKRVVNSFHWTHALVFLIFFSGVLLFPLAAWFTQAGRRRAAAVGTAVLGALLFASRWGGFTGLEAVMLVLFAVGGVLFLLQALSAAFRSPVRSDRFLAVWLLLGAGQMIFIMGWVAARYYLTVLPPAVFLAYRAWQGLHRHAPSAFNRRLTALGAGMLALGLGLAWADYAQAQTGRLVAKEAERDGWPAGGRGFFLGDSFTASYLKYAGWRPAFPDTPLEIGDLVMRPEVIMPSWWFRVRPENFAVVKVYEYPSRFPFRVMDNAGAAGFYASAWGALPFTISRSPLERYTLLQVRRREGRGEGE